jgi:GT2 family glycosyltransferase
MGVCALIVNWNCRDETLSCLAALQRSTLIPATIVIDNGSSDGSVEAIRAVFPATTVVPVGYNSGFAAAVNRGLCHPLAQAHEFVLLLNNDVDLAPDALAELVAAAHNAPDIALFSASICYKDRPNVLWSTGYFWVPVTFTTIGSERGRAVRANSGLRRVAMVELCAVLVRRSLFEQVGLLDERFFVYYEDLDLCLRARNAGLGIACVRAARAWHTVSASTSNAGALRAYHMARASVQFFAKHTPPLLRLPVSYYRSYSALRLLLSALVRGQRATAGAYLRGLADGLFLAAGTDSKVEQCQRIH